jgi:hypothetical protein
MTARVAVALADLVCPHVVAQSRVAEGEHVIAPVACQVRRAVAGVHGEHVVTTAADAALVDACGVTRTATTRDSGAVNGDM